MNFYEVLFTLKTGTNGFVNHYETLFANALNGGAPTPTLLSITAVFNQGSATIYDTDSLDSLKQYLTVTATYDDSSTDTITTYTLSGTLTVGTSTITVTYQGKTDTFSVTVTQHSILPSGYTQVDYISSNYSGSPSATKLTTTPYIKTNFPSNDTDILNFTVKLVYECNFNTVTAIPFGGRNGTSNSNTTRGCVVNLGATDTVINYGNISGQTLLIRSATGSDISLNTKHTIVLHGGDVLLDGSQIVQTNATSAIQMSAYKWGLFGRNNGAHWDATSSGGDLSPMIGKIYEFSIKDGSDNYVLNYIPCKRDSDNTYGMYDVVSGTFLTSAIATGFIGGND